MKETTLGYIECKGCYLMLYRNKKGNDPNKGKWIGVGGHLEPGENSDDCFQREVREETGIELSSFTKRGEIEFISDTAENELMHLYTANIESEEVDNCNEGTLQWIEKEKILDLNLWEGDRYFLEPLIAGENDIKMRLIYHGDLLVKVER